MFDPVSATIAVATIGSAVIASQGASKAAKTQAKAARTAGIEFNDMIKLIIDSAKRRYNLEEIVKNNSKY